MLAKRTGKNGEFWGCGGYPDCKATFNDLNGGPDFDFLPANIRKKTAAIIAGLAIGATCLWAISAWQNISREELIDILLAALY